MRVMVLSLTLVFVACSPSSNVGRDVGARCDSSDECDDRCLAPEDFPGGFCSLSCDTAGDCPGGTACVDVEGGVCLFTCSDATGCEFLGQGYECETEEFGDGSDGTVEVCR